MFGGVSRLNVTSLPRTFSVSPQLGFLLSTLVSGAAAVRALCAAATLAPGHRLAVVCRGACLDKYVGVGHAAFMGAKGAYQGTGATPHNNSLDAPHGAY